MNNAARRNCTDNAIRGTRARQRRGAVVVELALVTPILFLLLFACVEFARMTTMRHAADTAAYEAARLVVVPGGTSAEATAQANAMLGVFGFQGATVTINPTSLGDNDQSVTVTVDLPVDQNSWAFLRFTETMMVRGTSTLRTERYRPI